VQPLTTDSTTTLRRALELLRAGQTEECLKVLDTIHDDDSRASKAVAAIKLACQFAIPGEWPGVDGEAIEAIKALITRIAERLAGGN
jgi:hypothetical protein